MYHEMICNMLSTILLTSTAGAQENEVIAAIAIVFVLILWLWIWFFLPASMAKKRGRSQIGWIILFWIISPFWGIIALLILGDSKKKIRKEIMEELSNKEA